MAISFALLLHAHQPAGNFDDVIERVYADAYRPLLEALAAAPALRFNLHYSGYLLDWLARRHPEHLALVAKLVRAERVEVLGGGYFEPILPAIRKADRLAQLRRLSRAVTERFGRAPRGLWLAERVWEPELPETLAAAGLEYTVLDDAHFLLAGVEPTELHGAFLTESQGSRLRLVPSSLFLRQAIPFRPVEESIAFLREAAVRTPGSLLCMGDDLEKFGSWPNTHQHVFVDGWLRHFLEALAAHAGEIETVRLGDYLDQHAARGPVYLPTASYPEMMRWAAGTAGENAAAPWQAFLRRYRESNWLHKQQLDISARLEAWREGHPEQDGNSVYEAACDALLAAQSNDAYWHGWFGGLYAPHLRDFLYTRLLRADRLLGQLDDQIDDRFEGPRPPRRFDLDCDGSDEVELRTGNLRAWFTPHDAGCMTELDLRPADTNLMNSLQRRPEPYHPRILDQAAANPAGLPGGAMRADAGLAAHLVYDAYPRSGGRLWLMPRAAGLAEFASGKAGEDREVAGGAYEIVELRPGLARLRGKAGVEKQWRLWDDGESGRLELRCALPENRRGGRAALELVFNFLAPNAADRGWRIASGDSETRLPLSFQGELPSGALDLWDGWRRLRIHCEAPGAVAWWIVPTWSVSQADTGFEAVYQGSGLAAVWPEGTAELVIHVTASMTPAQ